MLSSNFEFGQTEDSDASNGELLREIEEISEALYLDNKTHQNSLISSSDLVPKSTLSDLKSKPKLGFGGDDVWLWEEKKPSSIWNWKPLKALSHIRRKKFTCCFFCHVHFIENLPSDFDGFSMSVHWKRKDNVLRTLPSRVSNGVVEFEETLMSKCNVYGEKNGHGNFVKYEPKHFLLYGSIVRAGGLDIGKHWVDFTRLLPVTVEELEEDKCSGRWSTSFKLTGKAEGATLHVSFAFLVMNDGLAQFDSNTKLPLLLNLERNGLKRLSFIADFEPDRGGDAMLRRVGSVPSSFTNISSNPLQSLDLKFDWSKDISDFSNSVNMLYGKLEEGSAGGPAKFDLILEQLDSLKLVPNSFSSSGIKFGRAEYDEAEPVVIDKAMESEQNPDKEIILDESAVVDLDVSVVEVIDVSEIFEDEGISSNEDTKSSIKDGSLGCVENDDLMVKHSVAQIDDTNAEREALDFLKVLILESVELESSMNEICSDNEVNHKGRKLMKSLSLDDVSKTVADDFLNLLQEARSPSAWSSNGDLESPREQLLRQFEEDMRTSGSFFLGVEEEDEESDYAAPSVSSSDYSFDNIDLLPALDISRHKSVNQLSKSKMKAKTLEQLETESLMQRWGLNEDAFLSSLNHSTGGFGSPIYVPPEEPIGLPPLGDGLGPLLHLKDGGLLRSMSPLIFKNVKKCGSLVMQASKPIVLPRKLGSDIMDILHCMASVGIYRLSKQLHKLMPLEELSGRIIHQLAWEASCKADPLKRSVSSEEVSDVKNEVEEAPKALHMESDCVFVKDLAFLALNSLEVHIIEGLRIQCGMSDEEAPSSIKVKSKSEILSHDRVTYLNGSSSDSYGVNYVEELLDLSISLDEWLSLDPGKFGEGGERRMKVVAAHHDRANHSHPDPNNRNSSDSQKEKENLKCGLLGNSLTVAVMIQLRDPLRNYEPVGAPILGLIQVERSLEVEEYDEVSKLRVIEVHIAGLNIGYGNPEIWASKRQRQSGPRWLLASGLTKNHNSHISDTRLIIRRPNQVCTNPWATNFMWSISNDFRNPDIVFPEDAM